jgi:RNA polymerase sigma-70 factor (ECF subfamily)
MASAAHTTGVKPQLELDMGPPPSDEELMRAFQGGGKHAFAVLMERYGEKVLNYAWRLTDDYALAQDLAQQAFLAVYVHKRTFDTERRFSPWLYRIVGNLCRMEWRRRRRKVAPLDGSSVAAGDPAALAADTVADPSPSPAEEAGRRDLERRVHRAVGELPEKLRMVFVLSFYERLSYKQIGEVLGCAVGTVASRKHLAVQRLAQSLSAVGAELFGDTKA